MLSTSKTVSAYGTKDDVFLLSFLSSFLSLQINVFFFFVLQALPDDETVFFERTPLHELQLTDLAAFGETSPHRESTIEQMVNNGLIVRVRDQQRSFVSGWVTNNGPIGRGVSSQQRYYFQGE